METEMKLMKPDEIEERILACLAHAKTRDEEKGIEDSHGIRNSREMSDWIGNYVFPPEINRILQRMEEKGTVEGLGKIEGLGNANYWRLPVPRPKNTLVVIGYVGVKRAYLNMSEEDALHRHLEEEWPEGWDEATEAETRSRMTSFEFADTFAAYDASAI
jgi:hypothetical protein